MSDEMFELGRQKGAMDFCEYLRGKITPSVLLSAWEDFQSSYATAQALSAPDVLLPVPNQAMKGFNAGAEIRKEQRDADH